VQRALEVGGRGYVLKAQAGSDLLPAVEAVLRGQRFVSGGLSARAFTAPGANTNQSGSQSRVRSSHKKAADHLPPDPLTA
jgi:DNA-binding NarL/FixJ family response regulator